MIYTVPFHAVALSGTLNTFKTVAEIIVPATARCAIVRVAMGPADATPDDQDVVLKIARNSGTLGTGGTAIAAAAIPKSEPAGRDALCSARVAPTGEPATYEANGDFMLSFNDRGGIDHPFMTEDQEPKVVGGATVSFGLLACSMKTGTARVVSGYVAFREY